MTNIATVSQVPSTAKRPVTIEYHGVQVIDDYQWLEDFSSPEVRQWNEAQNRYTRALLDVIPERQAIARRLTELYTQASSDHYALQYQGKKLFALKVQPPKQQPLLVWLESAEDSASEHVIVDLNLYDPSGATSVDFYAPSPDGRLVAMALSKNGSEQADLHFFETASGKELEDIIPRVNYPTAGGSVAWNADSSGVYYTRYPHSGERAPEDLNFYQQAYFHKLDTQESADNYLLGKDFPRIAEITLKTYPESDYLLVQVANGDGGEFAHYLLDPAGKWTQLTSFSDQITQAEFGPDGSLYILSHKDAPLGQIFRLSLAQPDLSLAQRVVGEGDASIQDFTPTATLLYVAQVIGGPSEIRIFSHSGERQGILPTPPISAIQQIVHTEGDEILFRHTSFIDPPAWYRFTPSEEEPQRTALYVTSPADFSDVEVVREFANSKDGTRIPLNIIRKKGLTLAGKCPTILYGYGGYGVNLSPGFNVRRRLWLDYGGVYIIANLRGGSEYGESWHQMGNLTRKQNVFDDFIACARYIIEAGYTNPGRLAIEGGSNGGLLMGAALTQHPEQFRAVVALVGVYDMLRTELEPNGAFNVTEYGTVKDPIQFEALYAYSPYHRVRPGVKYPAVLLVAGENDGRVNPHNSRKMVAQLQAASSSGLPVLLRTSSSSGHGFGTALSDKIAQDTDIFAFLFDQLNVSAGE